MRDEQPNPLHTRLDPPQEHRMCSVASAFTVERRHPVIGTEVRGIDLREPLDPDTVRALRAPWLEPPLLVFPDQPISDERHVQFGRHFGALEVHVSHSHRSSRIPEIYRVSNLDEAGNLIPPEDAGCQYLSQSWRCHTDSSFREVPSVPTGP